MICDRIGFVLLILFTKIAIILKNLKDTRFIILIYVKEGKASLRWRRQRAGRFYDFS